MNKAYRITLRQLRRANEANADNMGLLSREKSLSGAPQSYKLVIEEEIEALIEAQIRYFPVSSVQHMRLGWVHPDVYDLIVIYEENDGYSDVTLSEWLRKTYIPRSE